MCGIAGWVGEAGKPPPSLEQMSEAMWSRGPDEGGIARFAGAGLACRRLALVDVEHGHQPVANEDRTLWGLLNGEIYNHAELRRELERRGHRLQTHCDSELVPHLFEEWGPSFLKRLRGMFALACYNSVTGELFLARDPFGIKPLYLAELPGQILFASEARAIFASGIVERRVDETSLRHYLGFGYVPDPATMWQGLHKLPPGHYLQARRGQVSVHRYWRPQFDPAPNGSIQETGTDIEERLRDSVRAHLEADVPVGAYLSSGVDSNLLVALAARIRQVKTFSVGFDTSQDELEGARALAALLGTEHHEEVISGTAYRDALPNIVASQEEPLADPSAPALWFLARAAGSEVKAVISGEGADEIFAGYPLYLLGRRRRAFERLPERLQAGIGRSAALLPDGMKGKGFLERTSTPLERWFLGSAALFDADEERVLLASGLGGPEAQPSSTDLVAPYYEGLDGADPVVKMQTVACQTWLPSSILMKADKMGMAHSLEVRVPYLDREVFAAASVVPLEQRAGRGQTKLALRAAAERVLPPEIAQRPKFGFPVPFRSWLEGEMSGLVRELLASTGDSLLDRRGVEQLLGDKRRPDHHRRTWAILIYLLWSDAMGANPR